MIEKKVTAATAASASITFVLWVLSHFVFGAEVPDAVAGIVAVVVPAIVTFVAGYVTRHTNRPDLGYAPEHAE